LNVGAYLTGAFGQSNKLYEARNEAKRGRIAPLNIKDIVNKQILEDTKTIIDKQKKAGFSFIIDPMFNVYYLFQQFSDNVKGVKIGPQENWFDNNVFYWIPLIDKPLNTKQELFTRNIHLNLLPEENTMVILPSPYSLLMLSHVDYVKGYDNKKSAIIDISEIIKQEANKLAEKGVKRIQYDEPAFVKKQSLGSLEKEDFELLEIALEKCGKIKNIETSLHTYFGDAGPIINYLINLPVDCIGIDATETRLEDVLKNDFSKKELAIGLINARESYIEDVDELVSKLKLIKNRSRPKALWLTPNTGTEYIGWTYGLKKMNILKKAVEAFKNE